MCEDSVTNAIYQGMKRGIQVAIQNECHGSAVILILSAIDAMAFLNMPSAQTDVTRDDFVKWVERYIKFPCQEQLTGLDLYGARCGMLHNYSSQSRLSRNGDCRNVVYADNITPEITYNPSVDEGVVVVSIQALANAFYEGLDRFLVDLFADSAKASVAEQRVPWLMTTMPFSRDGATQ